MNENNFVPGPVPLPRIRGTTKIPIPLPRTTTNVLTSEENKEDAKVQIKSDKQTRQEHANSLRKSLRKVSNNVQEKSNAVIMSAKNVSSKMELSVRNILSKRHTVSGVGESQEGKEDSNVRCQSLPCDEIFRNISFDSPLSTPDDVTYSEPPSYPPPPPPDESHYDELRSSKSGSIVNSEELSVTEKSSIYEEINYCNNLSGACSPCPSSADVGAVLNRCDSWNYYDAPVAIAKPRGHSYENVALEYLPTESSQNIYSDEPAKNKIYKKPILFPSDSGSVCSSRASANESYENWQPTSTSKRPGDSTSSRSEKSFATKSVIYEFDPLFVERFNKTKPKPEEKRDNLEAHCSNTEPQVAFEVQKSSTVPANLNSVANIDTTDDVQSEGEYFLYHRAGAYKGLLDDEPKEIPVVTQGRKKGSLVRWDSMKKAIKMVTDSAPWSPIMGRKNQKNRDAGCVSGNVNKACKLGSVHNGYLLKSPSNGEKIKDFVTKWCQLADGNITLLSDKNSTSKEVIGMETILSIQSVLETKLR